MGNVKIVSDGTTHGTNVLVNGEPIKNVKSVTIHPMTGPHEMVRVTIEVIGPELEIEVLELPKQEM